MALQTIEHNAVDYRALIDDETWALIDRYSAHYPENSIRLPMTEQRRLYDSMTASLCPANLPEIAWRDTVMGGGHPVPVRQYGDGAAAAMILFCHGGGFALGSVETHHPICLDIVAQTGLDLVSVDYRLAPEHIHPAQYEDVSSVFDWLCQNDSRPIILMGDSAGGTLAACLAHTKRHQLGRVLGQILIYPGLGAPPTSPSYITHAQAPLLRAADVDYWRAIRLGSTPPIEDTRYRALCDSDYGHLPPTVCITAECDPLTSDSEIYVERIRAAGGRALWLDCPGLIHGFLHGRRLGNRLRQGFQLVVDATTAVAATDWPAAQALSHR